MARPKPIGFDNHRTHNIIATDGSAFSAWRKCSFAYEIGGKYRFFSGPSIANTTQANPMVVTTTEAHGFKSGQKVFLYGILEPVGEIANKTELVVTYINATQFSVNVNASTLVPTSGVGMVGVDIEAEISAAGYALIPGGNCVDEHPAAWEMPLIG